MGLKRVLPLLPLAVSLARAQDQDVAGSAIDAVDELIPGPDYSADACDGWISNLLLADTDSSRGLSESEYYDFLTSIEDPPYVKEYFAKYDSFDKLPWSFRIVHKSLACHCHQLGMGQQCCEGGDAEVLLLGLDPSISTLMMDATSVSRIAPQDEYKNLVCEQVSYVLKRSVPSPAPTPAPSDGPTPSPTEAPAFYYEPTVSPTEMEVVEDEDEEPMEILSLSAPQEEEEGGGLGVGGIVGIVLALLAILAAVIFAVQYRKKLERDRLRAFAGIQADLESPPPGEECSPWKTPNPDGDGGGTHEAPMDDDESEAPSVWSESDEASDGEKVAGDGDEAPEATAGSALAAMGAASTVAANLRRASVEAPVEDSGVLT